MSLVKGVHFEIFSFESDLMDLGRIVGHLGFFLPYLCSVFPGLLPETDLLARDLCGEFDAYR